MMEILRLKFSFFFLLTSFFKGLLPLFPTVVFTPFLEFLIDRKGRQCRLCSSKCIYVTVKTIDFLFIQNERKKETLAACYLNSFNQINISTLRFHFNLF